MAEKDDKKQEEIEIRKLCTNCAYRKFCNKRFSANVVNGQVQCNEYAPDVEIIAKLKAENRQDSSED